MASLSRQSAPPKEMSRAKSVRKTTSITGAVPSLTYTIAQKIEPTAHLSSLTDSRSNYPAVARSCFQLNQFAGTAHAPPLHDIMFSKTCSAMFSALAECLEAHQDRRCRILAAKTLALTARSAYARIRHSPLLYGIRDGTLHRLEDEVGTDVPVALCTAAMDDADDGVSACAVEALGMLCLSSNNMVGAIVEDELLREVDGIAHTRPCTYAPSLSDLSDEDPSIPQTELQSRIYENVLLPRIWRLVKRLLQYSNPTDLLRTLPFYTSCLVHLVKLMPSATLDMDRATFAKRWIEVDIMGLVQQVVINILLPSLQSETNGGLAHVAALAGLRLAHVCPFDAWTHPLCSAASKVLLQEVSATPVVLEHSLTIIASLLVALRALPLSERMPTLECIVNEIRFLPATSLVPPSVTTAAVAVGNFNRRSARMGLLTELALNILIDGPSEKMRSKYLKEFLSSPEVSSLLIARRHQKNGRKWNSNQSTASNADGGKNSSTEAPGGKSPIEAFTGTHVAEEFVLAFCSVASAYGQKVMESGKSIQNRHTQEWVRCTLAILNSTCSACVNWKSRTSQDDEDLFSMLLACQASYIQLMVECFHAVGFLSVASSVTLFLLPLSTPLRSLLLERLAHTIAGLARYPPIVGSRFIHSKEMATLADQFMEYKFREGIPNRHTRISLIALFSDHWVQCLDSEKNDSESYNMNDMNARELLTMLSSEISLLSRQLNDGVGNNLVSLNYLDVCVASVENIALMACDWARRHGSGSGNDEAFRKDIDEDVAYIVSTATAALEGKNLREGDVMDSDSQDEQQSPYPMLPICAEAVKRIQSVANAMAGNSDGYDTKPALHSLLVSSAGRDYKRRLSSGFAMKHPSKHSYAQVESSPFIALSPEQELDVPIVSGDASIHAFFVQYCIQVIGSRIDQSMNASTLVDLAVTPILARAGDGEEKQGIIKTRNWLRLSVTSPPLHIPLAARISCAGAVTTLSGASDPVTFVIAYSMRRCLRYDCEMEYKLFATLRVHNVTAVQISNGVRMDLRVTQQRSAFEVEGTVEDHVLLSNTAFFKHEIKAGEQITWEVALDHWPMKGFLELHPSITFRDMDVEHVPSKMVTLSDGDITEEKATEQEDDDSQHTDGVSIEERTIAEDEDENVDVTLTAEPIRLSPMLGMQPSPLVFFRSRSGDLDTFRFMWHQMPNRMGEMALYPNPFPGQLIGSDCDDFGTAVARLACVDGVNESIGSGLATKGWAFTTLTGDNLLCLMVQDSQVDEAGNELSIATLYFRADDVHLLYSIMGSDDTRNVVVSSLTENKWVCDSLMF